MALALLLKLLLAPCLVVSSSLAARRWGPRVAGFFVVLPIVAGPILLIVYLEQGLVFAEQAAVAATLGVVPLAGYAVVFALVSRRCGWALSLLASCLTVLLVDLALVQVHLPAGVALLLAVLALSAAAVALRRLGGRLTPSPPAPWWDLPARALVTAVAVLVVTGAADALGPVWTGVLTPFPIALSVLCAFVAAQEGHVGVVALLQGVVPGLNGFALFFVTVALGSSRLGWTAAFVLGTAIACAFSLVLASRRDRAPQR